MKIVCTMPVRNEAWILGLSARALLRWVDELVILDHASTDDTAAIWSDLSSEFKHRVHVIIDPIPIWEEMRHRQTLLEAARSRQATHIAMVDADEILSANLLPTIRNHFAGLLPCEVLQLPWLCLRGSLESVHTSGMWSEQHVSCGFLDDPIWHWSSGGRGGYDFHHRHPMGRQLRTTRPIAGRGAGLMHLQFVSDRRLRAKQYLYQLTERLRWPDKFTPQEIRARYSATVHAHNGHQGTPVPADWWSGYEDLMQYLRLDEEPWQLAECQRILAENPGIEAGLDSFGLF